MRDAPALGALEQGSVPTMNLNNDYRIDLCSTPPEFIHIGNAGPKLVETNWWSMPVGKTHFFLSTNAGCMRLLVPKAHLNSLKEMKRGVKHVIISRERTIPAFGFAVEILFEDGSDSPFALHLASGQLDVLLDPNQPLTDLELVVYVDRNGPHEVFRKKAYYRVVPSIPWLQPIQK
jgi:hypothetical protein